MTARHSPASTGCMFEPLEPRRLFSALFQAADKFPTGGAGAAAMATADFNGDGLPDVAVSNYNDGTVTIFLNQGKGKFTAMTPFMVGSGPSSIAVGDFNGDGKPDLAIITTDLAIALGTGGGHFAPLVHYTAGIGPQNVIAADFNGDKKTDLAVTDAFGDSVLIFKGQGNGKFGTPSTIAGIPGAAGIVAGDFTGDKKLDLAVTSFGHISFNASGNLIAGPSDGVRLLIGDGNGGFKLGGHFEVFGKTPTYIAAGDLNGDGKLDLVTTDGGLGGDVGTPTVSVLLNYGGGHFAYPKVYHTGASPQNVTLADVNHDGKLDIITADYLGGDVGVLTQQSSGYYFNSVIMLPTGIGATGVIVLDVNGDKKPDILSDENDAGVLDVLLAT